MADANIRVNLNAKEFKNQTSGVLKSTKEIEQSLSGIATKAGIAFAAFSGGIAATIKSAANFETIGVQFEVLTGSVEASNAALDQLKEFSAGTPFQFDQIARAGKTLLAFGTEVGDLETRLQQLGDVSAASGKDLGELSVIFGQIQAQGRLTGERLNQLNEAGIAIGPALAESLGVAESSVRDLVSQGQVDFDTFEKAFASLSAEGGVAFGGLSKLSQTFAGRLSTLGDNFSLLVADIGEKFLPVAKEAVTALTNFIQNLRSNPETAQFLAQMLGIGAAVAGVVTAIAGIGLIVTQVIPVVVAGFTAIGTVIGLVLSPVGLLVAALAGIATVATLGFDKTLTVAQEFAGGLFEIFSGIGNVLVGIFTLNPERISEGLEQAKNAVLEGVGSLNEALFEKENETKDEEGNGLLTRLFSPPPMKIKERLDQAKAITEQASKEEIERQKLENEVKEELRLEEQKRERDFQKQFIRDQEQFGSAIATISRALNDERVKNAEGAGKELIKLQNSENATLKAIGKAAAVVQITIDTARSAMAIYNGFVSSIPFPPVSIPLGIAGAAAAVAFGATQIAKVVSANTGGVVPGMGPNRDSVPAMLTPGELVVPRQNFDEVISAVSAQRQGNGGPTDSFGTRGPTVRVEYESEEASRIITAQETEDSALGLSRREAVS